MPTAGTFMMPVHGRRRPVPGMTWKGEWYHCHGMSHPKNPRTRLKYSAPGDGDRRGADRVLEHEVPADDPRHELAHRRVGVGVGAAGDRNHRRELGVAESGERAADAGDEERERHRRARAIRDGGRRADEEARADDGADARARRATTGPASASARPRPSPRRRPCRRSIDFVRNNAPATMSLPSLRLSTVDGRCPQAAGKKRRDYIVSRSAFRY